MNKILNNLAFNLRETFPETYKKIKSNKRLSSLQYNHVYYFVLGFIKTLQLVETEVPPIIILNMSCDRLDRLFLIEVE